MNAAGPALRDIHLPPVSWWPPAPGWWLLAGLILLAIPVAIWALKHRRKRIAPRAAMLAELDALSAGHARDHDDVALAAGLSRLLRRVAILLEPAAAASDLSAWRVFLQTRVPDAFTPQQLECLSEAPYRARISFDADALTGAVRDWCERALQKRP